MEGNIPAILKLGTAFDVLGPELRVGALAQEIVRFLGTELPGVRFGLLVWDEQKKTFLPPAGEVASVPESRAVAASGPVFKGQEFFVPLFDGPRFLGVLAAGIGEGAPEKDQVIRLGRIAEMALGNALMLIESETRSMDMFRFNVLSRALNPTVNEDEVLKILAEALSGMVNCDAFGFLIYGKNNQTMLIRSRVPLSRQCLGFIEENLAQVISNLTRLSSRPQGIKRVINVPEGSDDGRQIRSMLNAPLITKGKVIGVMSVYGTGNEGFSPRDQRNLSSLSSHGAVAFENAMLYGDLKQTYFSIINALASAIEAKDEYTRGHSDLVSRYSMAIAAAMNLTPSTIESIQIAGLLHDLGKIGVPEDILGKKGKLTDSEFDIVKEHPAIAMKILGPVEFPHFNDKGNDESARDPSPELTLSLFEHADLSADVKLMIYHHHEKFAGGGYPRGLSRDEIPLGARILAVADTFEALTADRPYRKAFPIEEGLKIITELSGTQLDPEIVWIFIELVKSKGIEALRNWQGF